MPTIQKKTTHTFTWSLLFGHGFIVNRRAASHHGVVREAATLHPGVYPCVEVIVQETHCIVSVSGWTEVDRDARWVAYASPLAIEGRCGVVRNAVIVSR